MRLRNVDKENIQVNISKIPKSDLFKEGQQYLSSKKTSVRKPMLMRVSQEVLSPS